MSHTQCSADIEVCELCDCCCLHSIWIWNFLQPFPDCYNQYLCPLTRFPHEKCIHKGFYSTVVQTYLCFTNQPCMDS